MNEWMNKQELGFGLHNCFRNTHIQWLKISRVTPRNIHFNRLPRWFLISPLNTSFAEWAEIRYWQWEWSRREKFGKGCFFYLVCTFLLTIILPLFVYGQQDLCNQLFFSSSSTIYYDLKLYTSNAAGIIIFSICYLAILISNFFWDNE